MLTPPTIMTVAISRNAITPRLADLIKNPGKTKPRIILNIATKTGRVLTKVETRDIGPFDIAQNESSIDSGAHVSLRASKVIVEPLRFISFNCLIVPGRSEIIRKIRQEIIIVRLYMFQNER